VKIPAGFAVTAEGYRHVLTSAGILDDLTQLVLGIDRDPGVKRVEEEVLKNR